MRHGKPKSIKRDSSSTVRELEPLEFAISCIPDKKGSLVATEAAKFRQIREEAEKQLRFFREQVMEVRRLKSRNEELERLIAGGSFESANNVVRNRLLRFMASIGYRDRMERATRGQNIIFLAKMAVSLADVSFRMVTDVFTNLMDGNKEDGLKMAKDWFEKSLNATGLLEPEVESEETKSCE